MPRRCWPNRVATGTTTARNPVKAARLATRRSVRSRLTLCPSPWSGSEVRSAAKRRSRRSSRACRTRRPPRRACTTENGRVAPAVSYQSTRLRSLHVRSDELPVDQVPERLDVLRTRVAVVDVVRVLPDVAGQQRGVFAGQRGVGVGGADQCNRAVG